ncbi:rhodanese-like domain-containing protein [Rubricoccus marinus]
MDAQAATPATAVETAAPATAVPATLSADEAVAYLAATPDAQLVDVRTAPEIAATGTLEGALALAYAPGFTGRAADALDPARPVVLFCGSGARSARAASDLAGAGFAEVANAGAFRTLAAAGLPTD